MVTWPATIHNERVKRADVHIGSSLQDFLKEEGALEDARAVATEEAMAFQAQTAMKRLCNQHDGEQ